MKDLRTKKIEKLLLGFNRLVDGSSDSNYFIVLRNITYRNAAFDIVEEVRLEWCEADQSTKIIDTKDVTWDVTSKFQDKMKSGQALEKIQSFNKRFIEDGL